MAKSSTARVTIYPKGGGAPVIVSAHHSVRLLKNGWQLKAPKPTTPPPAIADTEAGDK